jgi:hypothetical protein
MLLAPLRLGPSPGIKASVDALPTRVARFSSAREFLGEVVASSTSSEQEEEATTEALRTAFVAYEQTAVRSDDDENSDASGAGWAATSSSGSIALSSGQQPSSQQPQPLPCHISFLSSRTNDAMVDMLGPLLPVARLLNVPVLDFDVYARTRDSDAVAADLVPAVVAWLARVV